MRGLARIKLGNYHLAWHPGGEQRLRSASISEASWQARCARSRCRRDVAVSSAPHAMAMAAGLAFSSGSTWMVMRAPSILTASAASMRSQMPCDVRTVMSPGTTR